MKWGGGGGGGVQSLMRAQVNFIGTQLTSSKSLSPPPPPPQKKAISRDLPPMVLTSIFVL